MNQNHIKQIYRNEINLLFDIFFKGSRFYLNVKSFLGNN